MSVLAFPVLVVAFKPVIMMHGVGSGAGEMATIARLLNETHPGTIATSLALYENSPAAWDHDLKTQVAGVTDAIRKLVAADPALYADGYHMVCKSQGALTCRAVIESMDDHNVDTFVSLAGPQGGVYGPDFFASFEKRIPFLQNVTASAMWLVAYNFLGQKISVANIWRDPHHLDAYMKGNVFLPKYTTDSTAQMKANFVRLKKAVFCVGSGPSFDGGIEPWQSAVFGAAGADGVIRPMEDQDFYKSDTFGLRSLHESGRLNFTVVPNATHGSWTGDEAQITALVLPHIASYA